MNSVIRDSGMNTSRLVGAYLGDIKYELVKMLRTPAFAVPTMVFPVMFYLIFGVLMGSARGNAQAAQYAFSGLSVFGTIAPGLFGFGVSLAFEREYGTLTYKQALPMPPGSYLLARMSMAMIFASIITLLLVGVAHFLGHVPFGFLQTLRIYLIGVLGVLPFCAIGLTIGSFVSGQAAPAIVNIIYLPMAFLSGLWVPLPMLGHTLQQFAPLWPAYHLAQLSYGVMGSPSLGSTATHVFALAGFTIVFFTLAMRRLSSGGLHMFGNSRRGGFALSRAVTNGIFFLGIAFIVTGILRGADPMPVTTETAATSTEAEAARTPNTATAPRVSNAPVGVAAPANGLVSDFDSDSDKASFGDGWFAGGDDRQGGHSVATERIVDGGAGGSKSSLEVSGTINSGAAYPSAGTTFFPGGLAKSMDLSGKQTLSLWVRGAEQPGYVVIIHDGYQPGGVPPMFPFTFEPEWREIHVPLHELGGLDLKRVKLVTVITTGVTGPFKFQIDNVRVE